MSSALLSIEPQKTCMSSQSVQLLSITHCNSSLLHSTAKAQLLQCCRLPADRRHPAVITHRCTHTNRYTLFLIALLFTSSFTSWICVQPNLRGAAQHTLAAVQNSCLPPPQNAFPTLLAQYAREAAGPRHSTAHMCSCRRLDPQEPTHIPSATAAAAGALRLSTALTSCTTTSPSI
ncbi:hypothetical protein COO60DRAFT_219241 [Scenedesmus sp. NREL 46B-D3]|nr:hypothetical protein COO60DRAFT_219241 [Scenedesmus sp. NREL 46B-D3]